MSKMASPIFDFLFRMFGSSDASGVSGQGDGPAPSTESHSKPNEHSSKVFGLVIGINEYQRASIGNLQGAVPDANEIVRYLRERLHVPESQITKLYDHAATRSKIIEAFQSLATDPRIKNQDPIIIFYAGHGSELKAPDDWQTINRKIQTLIPSDEGTIDSLGKKVESIPDYTLAALLNQLAQAKGDNVTVIFDSCHSSSGTRDDVTVRRVDSQFLTPLQQDTDQKIWSPGNTRALTIPKDHVLVGSRSHILIAACGAEETAKEKNKRGVFTKALLEVLDSVDADKLTYLGLMDRLRALPNQKPQCEGANKERVLFQDTVAGADPQFVQVLKVGNQYSLKAGVAQGIKVGARFDFHKDHFLDSNKNPSLGSFVVTSIGPRLSTLEPLALPKMMYARQTLDGRAHLLLVFFTESFVQKMDEDAEKWKSRLEMGYEGAVEFGYAKTESEAGLVVGFENDRVVFNTRDPLLTDNGLTRIPHTTDPDPDDVLPVIQAAAKWSWHVNRTNPEDPFRGMVRIEITRIAPKDGNALAPVTGNLNNASSGVVYLTPRPSEVYGFKLINESNYHLHPYLFYFDGNDMSITQVFEGAHGGAGGVDPQLPAKGTNGTQGPGELTLGYGSSEASPLAMKLAGQETHGVVVFKLFVTTQPTSFRALKLLPPFNREDRVPTLAPGYNTMDHADLWGTSMMVVVLRTPE